MFYGYHRQKYAKLLRIQIFFAIMFLQLGCKIFVIILRRNQNKKTKTL